MNRDAYVAANRAAWDATAPQHREAARWQELGAGFARPGFTCLDPVLAGLVERSGGVAGRDIAHLCCNNACELLSLRNMGAARCTGFDQSAAFLGQGRELARIAGQEIELVAGDIYALPATHDGAYDIVLVTCGALGWMPDLAAFFAIAARLLRPGGALLVAEQHPVLDMFLPDAERPFEIADPYFADRPYAGEAAIVYDGAAPAKVPVNYWFTHPLSAVVTAALDAGLRLESLQEYPVNISSAQFDIYERPNGANMPLSYAMAARKGQ